VKTSWEVPKLNFKIPTERVKTLRARGVDGHPFALLRQPFLLDYALESISPLVPEWLPESFALPGTSVKRQAAGITRLLANPLHGSPIIGIGSMPTDTRAKFLAMSIMDAAITQQASGAHKGKAMPLWHPVTGGYYDPLRDDKGDHRPNCSMLIITSVGRDSTSVKIEKVRDLLEIYHNIPRIVVVNGCDPVTFFADKIRMGLRYAFLLNDKSGPVSSSIMDI
jgi:hypothetical protein